MAEGHDQAREHDSHLPPFYSPRLNPSAPHNVPEHDLKAQDSAQPDRAQASALPSYLSLSSSEGEALPGFVSPAFTPPATPGTATPAQNREAASVPVDSSIPDGGCGAKKPRLLEVLPEVTCVVRARIPTTTGTEMFLHLYTNNVDQKEHLAIVFGNTIRSSSLDAVRAGETEMDRMIRGAYTGRLYPGRTTSQLPGSQAEVAKSDTPLVRIHSECYTGETAWSARCDCGEQLDEAARLMALPGSSGGVIVYLRQEGRGIGLGEKLKAYNLQDLGSDTVEANILLRHPADARSYGLATAMLQDLGQSEIRLLTNNPDKVRAVEGPNREVVVKERVAMVPLAWRGKGGIKSAEVGEYLRTKVSYFPTKFCIMSPANDNTD
jgi:GTP cyclohydrolase II